MKKNITAELLAVLTAMSLAASGCAAGTVGSTAGTAAAENAAEENTSEAESSSAGNTAGTAAAAENKTAENKAAETAKETASETAEAAEKSSGELLTSVEDLDLNDMFTDRDCDDSWNASSSTGITLDGSSITVSGQGAEASGSTVTITKEGTYVISGTLTEGQIVVDTGDSEKVQLVLNGVTMKNSTSACIYVKSADKVFVTLAEGTENSLSDTGAEYAADGENKVNAVIFAKDDICFNGSGTLTVNANYKHAISGKDDVKFTGGVYYLTAAGKGINANDSVRIKDGEFHINSEDDSIHSDNEEESGKGYVYIENGSFDIKTRDDGIHAATALVISDGDIDIAESKEGLEGDSVDINGGVIHVVSTDDGINAASGSSKTENSQDAGGKTGNGQNGQNGKMRGQDGQNGQNGEMRGHGGHGGFPGGQMPQGDMPQDAMSQTAGTREAGFRGGMPGGEMPGGTMPDGGQGGFGRGGFGDVEEECYIRITGGNVTVDAEGDGLDANGYIYIDGGYVVVNGPTNDGNGALDPGIAAYISGGTAILSGSAGMASTFSGESSQHSVIYYFNENQAAGTKVTLTDENGALIAGAEPTKSFRSIIISTPEMKEGEYTILAGNVSDTFTVDSIATSAGSGNRGWGGAGGSRK